MLTNVISQFLLHSERAGCETLFSWKTSYEEINQALESAERKKQTLHELFKEGKISSSTYEYVSKTINDAIEKIKARQIELKERMAKRAIELENQIKSSESLLAKLKSRCVSSDEKEKMHEYETQLSAFTSKLDAMKQEATYVKETQFKPVKPVSAPPNITGTPKIEKPIKVQTLITPLLKEKNIKEVTEKPKPETAKKPMPITPVPKIAKQPPAKKATVKPKAKKRRKKKPQIKRSLAERPRSRNASRGHCRNPWNGECKNTDIEVTIYYKKELLPICRSCWKEIAEKDLSW